MFTDMFKNTKKMINPIFTADDQKVENSKEKHPTF